MTQKSKLLAYLESHPQGITQLEAFNTLGCCRLSERVRECEHLGWVFSHTPEKTKNGARVIRYKIISQPETNDEKSPKRVVEVSQRRFYEAESQGETTSISTVS